jgi:hypothetical protein
MSDEFDFDAVLESNLCEIIQSADDDMAMDAITHSMGDLAIDDDIIFPVDIVERKTVPPASDEQRLIIEKSATMHQTVDSVAGSGKTTTIFHVVQDRIAAGVITTNRPALILTYNKKLADETRMRAQSIGIAADVFHVRTYHAFGYKYFGKSFCTDRGFIEFRAKIQAGKDFGAQLVGIEAPPAYSFIFMDEFQDVTSILFIFVRELVRWSRRSADLGTWPSLMILGDKYQCIYRFQGADERFLAYAHVLLSDPRDPVSWFTGGKLRTSYRITRQMADFLNYMLLGESVSAGLSERGLVAIKDGPKPKIRTYGKKINALAAADRFVGGYECITNAIEYLRHECGLKPYEIFILAPSLRPKIKLHNPLQKAAELLTHKYKDLIYIPNSDEASLSDQVMEKKLVFSTFHQSKGLERRAVIVLGFDESYTKYYCGEPVPEVLNTAGQTVYRAHNTIYVAATRAKEHLILCRMSDKAHLSYYRDRLAPIYTDSDRWAAQYKAAASPEPRSAPRGVSVTDLTRHQRQIVLDECMTEIAKGRLTHLDAQDQSELAVKNISNQFRKKANGRNKMWKEDVSDINGIVMMMYYEWKSTGSIGRIPNDTLRNITTTLAADDPSELIKAAMMLQAKLTGLDWKLHQFKQFNWIKIVDLEKAYGRLAAIHQSQMGPVAAPTTPDIWFEYECALDISNIATGYVPTTLTGCIDSLCGDSDLRQIVWEHKCVNEFKSEHFIQLAVYAYIMEINTFRLYKEAAERAAIGKMTAPTRPKSRKYILYNVRTNEGYEIRPKKSTSYKRIIQILICNKYHIREDLADQEFIECHTTDKGHDIPLLCADCIRVPQPDSR